MKTLTSTSHLQWSGVNPWTHYLTLDLFYLILNRSIFHSFICFLIPLCLLAIHRPPSSLSVRYTFIWACLVAIYHNLALWNHRLAHGRPRTVSLEDEVVLVAGGGGTGLGRLIAEVYAMKGVKGVAVLDVQIPERAAEREEWEDRGVRWFRCDVGKIEEVERVRDKILEEVIPDLTTPFSKTSSPTNSKSPLTLVRLSSTTTLPS